MALRFTILALFLAAFHGTCLALQVAPRASENAAMQIMSKVPPCAVSLILNSTSCAEHSRPLDTMLIRLSPLVCCRQCLIRRVRWPTYNALVMTLQLKRRQTSV